MQRLVRVPLHRQPDVGVPHEELTDPCWDTGLAEHDVRFNAQMRRQRQFLVHHRDAAAEQDPLAGHLSRRRPRLRRDHARAALDHSR